MSLKSIYGPKEHAYANPFAEALLRDLEFRKYVLSRTKFSHALEPEVLLDELLAKRSKTLKYWWKNAFTERCRCFGCSGSETDVFALLGDPKVGRFALHAEVKNPDDFFDPNKAQGERYPVRAACWATDAPPTIPAHEDFCTLLLCSATKVAEFADEARHFDAVITFEEIARDFPRATPATVTAATRPSHFREGQRVFHAKFGYGAIAVIEGNKLEIDFEQAGRKRVLDSFVSSG